MKRLAILMVFMLSGCPKPEEQSVIVNHRDDAIQVTYRGNRTAGPKPGCEILKPRLATAADARGMLEWGGDWNTNPAFRFDEEACEISVAVPPKSAAWISGRDSCGIRATDANFYQNWPAPIPMLRIESTQGRVEYLNWEAARAFTLETHWFGKDVCRLELH